MTPWWTQDWINHWGIAAFSVVFWPLTVLGATGAQGARSNACSTPTRRAVTALGAGIALGAALLVTALVASAAGQPEHVTGRLFLYGCLFVVIHATLLGAMVVSRRRIASRGVQP